MKIEIVTPVHNRRAETLQCLRSLARSETPGFDLHIIVVDDGSTDGTAEAIESEFPDVEIYRGDGNLWFTAGMNRGIEAAMKHDPDYVLAINNDTIFDEKCIANLVSCAERHPKSVVGPLLLLWDTPHKVFQVAPRWEFWRGGYRHWYQQTVWSVPTRPFHVDMIVGNCVLFPAAAIREAGLMDEKHLMHYGDAEYTPRMKRMGWNLLIEPTARVFNKPNDLSTGFRKLALGAKIRRLIFEPGSPYSLKRRYYTSLGGAPSKLLGMLAVPVFYARVLIGRNTEGVWATQQSEPPLAETFASAVLDD